MGRLAHLQGNTLSGSPHQLPRSPQPSSPALRRTSSSGAQRPFRQKQSSCCASARQPEGPDGEGAAEDSIDAEWRRRRFGALWASLSEQDRSWAVHGFAEDDVSALSTLEDSWDAGDSVLVTLWPAAKPATYCPAPGQQAWLHELSTVYVILFGAGTSDTEGIYSLRVMSREDGLPQDTIVAFSTKEDAERYAGLLEATMDHVPSVCPIEPKELLEFCTDSGYSYRVEAEGSLLIPPDYYVGITDWERSLRLREGKWTVRERGPASPAAEGASSCSEGSDESEQQEQAPPEEQLVGNNATYYSPSESSYVLEEQRARLERLAARDC